MSEFNLLQEVEEDLERQKLEALWRRFGPYVLGLALLTILITAGVTSIHSWRKQTNQKATEGLMAITAQKDVDGEKSIAAYEDFASHHMATDQANLALLEAASLAAKQGDKARALRIYADVSHNSKTDLAFRQLAELRSLEIQVDTEDAKGIISKLEPLTAVGAPFRFSAMELRGFLYVKLGDREKAKGIFTELSQNASVPHGMSERALNMLRYLDSQN